MYRFQEIIEYIKSLFGNRQFIPLHEPSFGGNEKKYLNDAIDSTFVSSVGEYVNRFEADLASFVGSKHAVAVVNGTSALHLALLVAGVKKDDEVITQALSFVATSNAICYAGAKPIFIDVDRETMGMSPKALEAFLSKYAVSKNDVTWNKLTGRRISACVPMHTFGHPCAIDEIAEICNLWGIALVEDAAEALGSKFRDKHTGTFGLLGTFSFNGNKTITSGGGGAIITNNKELAILAKHLSTQAKVPHSWDFSHDHVAYNYRMPNINAALACAQLEQLPNFLVRKRRLADRYHFFFKNHNIVFKKEPVGANSNYWLNTIEFENRSERDDFLILSNESNVMTRPPWNLMTDLPMFSSCYHDGLSNSRSLADRLVSLPSGVIQ